jgi:hypothetical protein
MLLLFTHGFIIFSSFNLLVGTQKIIAWALKS